MTMRSLKSLLPSSLVKRGIVERVSISLVLEYASNELARILGDETRTLARPLYVRRGVITIRCVHGAVAEEVMLNEDCLVGALTTRFPYVSIKSVHTIC